MIILEFTAKRPNAPKLYFIGADKQSIMNDTHQGKYFGGTNFNSYREITMQEAIALELKLLDVGILAIAKEGSKTFLIGQK